MKKIEEVRKEIGLLRVGDMNPTTLNMDKKDGVTFQGKKLLHQAKTDLCNIFKLQYGALATTTKDEAEIQKNWRDFSAAVARYRGKPNLRAVVNSETLQIERVLTPTKKDTDRIDFDAHLQFFEEKVSDGMELNQFYFDIRKMMLHGIIINPDTKLNVAKLDNWKTGYGFHLGRDNGWYSPAFLRLICTNGMMAVEQYLRKVIQGIGSLKSKILHCDEELAPLVQSKVKALINSPATVQELQSIRKCTDAEVFDKQFNVPAINRAYSRVGMTKDSIFNMPESWKLLANSNVKAYDLFNFATAQATHAADADPQSRTALNLEASRLLFTGPRLGSVPPDPFRRGH
jgi:hypothetical protein